MFFASASPALAKKAQPAPIDHGPRDQKRVALTFDACSGPAPGKLDQGVVEALEAAGAHATFFLGGRWAEQDHARVKRLLQNPAFELESHTYHHRHLETLGDAELASELARGSEALSPILGHAPTYMRAPYGEADARVVRAAKAAGLTTIGFDLPSGDPDPTFTAKRLTRWVLGSVRPGGIIVFHANGRGWHTAEALPGILAALKSQGYELVTIAELLGAATPAITPVPSADASDAGLAATPDAGADHN